LLVGVGNCKHRAAGEARPGFSGTFAHVGENGFGVRWLFGNGGSGAVWDALLWE